MSIYDSKKIFLFGIETRKLIYVAIAIIAIAIIALASMLVSSMLNQAIEARFLDNPLIISQRPYTLLEVKITNTTEKDAKGVEIEVSARDRSAIFVGPGFSDKKTIDTIERGQYRKLNFIVTPKKDASEGSYIVDIKVRMNGQLFTKEVALFVRQ